MKPMTLTVQQLEAKAREHRNIVMWDGGRRPESDTLIEVQHNDESGVGEIYTAVSDNRGFCDFLGWID